MAIKMAGTERVLKRQIINSGHPFVFFMAFTIFPIGKFMRTQHQRKDAELTALRTKSGPYRQCCVRLQPPC